MQLARVKVCYDWARMDDGKLNQYIASMQFSLDADNYEKVSGADNYTSLYEHGIFIKQKHDLNKEMDGING